MRLHKWLALLVALQVVFWVLGGFVMTLLPLDRVRGEHRVPPAQAVPINAGRIVPLAAVAGGPITAARLERTPRGVLWVLETSTGRNAVDAASGRRLPQMTSAEARRAAGAAYHGAVQPGTSVFLASAPAETGRDGPVWRVDFADAEGSRLYLDPLTGAVVSRRSDLWSVFDLMWRLHILDFDGGEDINNPLIVTLAGVTVAMAAAGLVLLWLRLVPGRLRPRREAGEP